MMKTKSIYNLIILILLTFILSSLLNPIIVNAGFGISPSDILYQHMKPGDHYEKKIVISRSDPEEDMMITIETELGVAENWVKFVPGKQFEFPENQQRAEFRVVIDVPTDAAFDQYKGTIRVIAASKEAAQSGVSVVKGAKVNVDLVTTNIDVSNIIIRSLKIDDTPAGDPLKLQMLIENLGNIPAAPSKVELEIVDLNGVFIESLTGGAVQKVPVGETQTVTSSFLPTVPEGEYYGNIKIYLDNNLLREDKIFFRITKGVPRTITADTSPGAVALTTKTATFGNVDLSNPMIPMLGFLVIFLVILLAILIIRRRTGDKAYKYITYVLGVSLITVVFSVVYVVLTTQPTKSLSVKVFNVEKEVSEDTDTSQEPQTSEVKGISTELKDLESEEELAPATLTVQTPEATGMYSVYRTPDIRSDIIYTAKDGDEFSVRDENDGWYQIVLPDGQLGWVEKHNIKASY